MLVAAPAPAPAPSQQNATDETDFIRDLPALTAETFSDLLSRAKKIDAELNNGGENALRLARVCLDLKLRTQAKIVINEMLGGKTCDLTPESSKILTQLMLDDFNQAMAEWDAAAKKRADARPSNLHIEDVLEQEDSKVEYIQLTLGAKLKDHGKTFEGTAYKLGASGGKIALRATNVGSSAEGTIEVGLKLPFFPPNTILKLFDLKKKQGHDIHFAEIDSKKPFAYFVVFRTQGKDYDKNPIPNPAGLGLSSICKEVNCNYQAGDEWSPAKDMIKRTHSPAPG